MLKNLKKTKLQPDVRIRDWSWFFSNANLMKLLAHLLHICDIVNLLQTCRRLYSFFHGTKFTAVIIEMIVRDCECEYTMRPLQFLSSRFNPKWKTIDGEQVKYFRSCYTCSSKINVTKITPISSTLCTYCMRCSLRFYRSISYKLMKCYNQVYPEDQWPRIERVLGRMAVEIGRDRLKKVSTAKQLINDIHNQIFALDLILNPGYRIVVIDGGLDVIRDETLSFDEENSGDSKRERSPHKGAFDGDYSKIKRVKVIIGPK